MSLFGKQRRERARLLKKAYDDIHHADSLRNELKDAYKEYKRTVVELGVESDDEGVYTTAMNLHIKLKNNFYSLLRVEDVADALETVRWTTPVDKMPSSFEINHEHILFSPHILPAHVLPHERWERPVGIYTTNADDLQKHPEWIHVEMIDQQGELLTNAWTMRNKPMTLRRAFPNRDAVIEFGQVFLDIIEEDDDNATLREAIAYISLVISQTVIARDNIKDLLDELKKTDDEDADEEGLHPERDLKEVDQYVARYEQLRGDV